MSVPMLVLHLAAAALSMASGPTPAPVKVIIGRAPTMAWVPNATAGDHLGRLIIVTSCEDYGVCMSTSTDLGASWDTGNVSAGPGDGGEGKAHAPLHMAGLPFSFDGGKGFFGIGALVALPGTQSLILEFANLTSMHPGGCDDGILQEYGPMQIKSTDAGRSWGQLLDVQRQIPSNPAKGCMIPTADASLILRADGPHPGRLLFCNVHDSYNGDIITYSDDGGETYKYSGQLHLPGQDECSLGQLANGSLLYISRSCNVSGGFSHANCETVRDDDGFAWRSPSLSGPGNHQFSYSISDDGGETWSLPLGRLPQTNTPVCQASLTSHKNSVYYSSPYNNWTRVNLTILATAADSSGVDFSRSLNLDPGPAGYSSVLCGLPGEYDCAVAYEGPRVGNASEGCRGGKCWVQFIRFASTDVR